MVRAQSEAGTMSPLPGRSSHQWAVQMGGGPSTVDATVRTQVSSGMPGSTESRSEAMTRVGIVRNAATRCPAGDVPVTP